MKHLTLETSKFLPLKPSFTFPFWNLFLREGPFTSFNFGSESYLIFLGRSTLVPNSSFLLKTVVPLLLKIWLILLAIILDKNVSHDKGRSTKTAWTRSSSSTFTPTTWSWSLIWEIFVKKDETNSPFSILAYLSLVLSFLFWLGIFLSYKFTRVSKHSFGVFKGVMTVMILSFIESNMILLAFAWFLLNALHPSFDVGISTSLVTYWYRSCSSNIFITLAFHLLKFEAPSSLSSGLIEIEVILEHETLVR